MKTHNTLRRSLRMLALSGVLLSSAAYADWDVQFSIPVQTQYDSYTSSTVYGSPGTQWTSTRQVPQTVCQQFWVNGSMREQCSTQFVTVQDNGYYAPAPVYVPTPVYVPSVTFGYPGYGRYGSQGYNHPGYVGRPSYDNRHDNHRRGTWSGHNNRPSGLNIHLNGR